MAAPRHRSDFRFDNYELRTHITSCGDPRIAADWFGGRQNHRDRPAKFLVPGDSAGVIINSGIGGGDDHGDISGGVEFAGAQR